MNKPDKYADLDKLPFKAKWAIDNLIDFCKEVQAENLSLSKKIETISNIERAIPFKEYNYKTLQIWKTQSCYSYNERNTPTYTVERLKELWEQDKIVFEENKLIAAKNEASYNLVIDLMERLGLKKTKWVLKSRRSYNKREITSEWVNEVSAAFPRGWHDPAQFYKDAIEKVTKYYNDVEADRVQKERESQKILQEQEKNALIIRLVDKYKMEFGYPIPPIYDIIDNLIDRNKYLYLAHYLYKNRCDWNDGPHYAECGLREFSVESPSDQEIYDKVNHHVYNWDGDGRVFNQYYSVLFGIVREQNEDLYNDYLKIKEYED